MRLDQRLVNVAQDVADHAVTFSRLDRGNRLDGLHPTGRVRRYVDCFLVIFLNASDGFAERAMQRRVVGKILANTLIDTIKLTLDDAFFGFLAGRQQNVAVAYRQSGLRARNSLGRNPETTVQALRRCLDGLVCRAANEIESRYNQDDPENCRGDWPRRDA